MSIARRQGKGLRSRGAQCVSQDELLISIVKPNEFVGNGDLRSLSKMSTEPSH